MVTKILEILKEVSDKGEELQNRKINPKGFSSYFPTKPLVFLVLHCIVLSLNSKW